MSANQSSPNPLRVAWSTLRAMRARRPRPIGAGTVDHSGFQPVLDAVAGGGVAALAGVTGELDGYLKQLADVDPDALDANGALAFWINAYNAAALRLARDTSAAGALSVLDLGDGFDRPAMEVAGETLSLHAIEHGKIRRFRDPRIHFALVCGSLSCPTLAAVPYRALLLEDQLERQACAFLAGGGAVADRDAGAITLSRILLWYGADFARPHRMPAWLPVSRARVLQSIQRWLPADVAAWAAEARPKVRFQSYDWGLGCSIR